MGSVTISQVWTIVLAAAAAIVSLIAAYNAIKGLLKPGEDKRISLINDVKSNKAMLDRDNQRLLMIEKSMKEQQDANAVLFRAMFAIINHDLTGNGNEVLKKSRDEIQDFLTNR